jgi:alkylated DNA repair dioxygenase AlkB
MESLPLNCEAKYHPGLLGARDSEELMRDLTTNYDVTNRSMRMPHGSMLQLQTGGLTFADEELLGFDKLAEAFGVRRVWSPLMQAVKDKVEAVAQDAFQVCRCIYYADGDAGVGYHSDLPAFGDTSLIASVSLGAEREFLLRDKDNPDAVHSMILGNGSLLLMGENCQERYEHSLPRDPECRSPRINLTFRRYGWR